MARSQRAAGATGRTGVLLLLVASAAASLALAEVALRILTPYPISEESNQRSHPLLGYVIDPRFPGIDERGFRNLETRLEDAEVAVVGDSHTFGYNVAAEQSFPALLARELGRPVYNFGIPSYGIYQYWILLEELASSSVSDVLLGFYPANDLVLHCPVTSRPAWRERALEAGLSAPSCDDEQQRARRAAERRSLGESLKDWVSSHVALGGALRALVGGPSRGGKLFRFPGDQHVAVGRVKKHARATRRDRPEIEAGYQDSLAILRDAKRAFERAGIRFSVLVIPSRERVLFAFSRERGAPLPERFAELIAHENALTADYLAFFEEQRIPARDALDEVVATLAAEVEKGGGIYPDHDDAHPFEQGYAAYARSAGALLRPSEREERD